MEEGAGSPEADTQNCSKSDQITGARRYYVFGVSAPYSNPYGSEKAIIWLLFSILYLFGHIFGCCDLLMHIAYAEHTKTFLIHRTNGGVTFLLATHIHVSRCPKMANLWLNPGQMDGGGSRLDRSTVCATSYPSINIWESITWVFFASSRHLSRLPCVEKPKG